ncbi:hypothetical protein MTO96_037187, partial [Rhipicephalus appendiculatus]
MHYAAAFSCVTRFLSLSAVKASVVKKLEVLDLVDNLLGFEALSMLIAFLVCLYHVGAGITVFQKARRSEHFALYLQLAGDVARMQATASNGADDFTDISDWDRHESYAPRLGSAVPRAAGDRDSTPYQTTLSAAIYYRLFQRSGDFLHLVHPIPGR